MSIRGRMAEHSVVDGHCGIVFCPEKDEAQTPTAVQKNLENSLLGDRSQTQAVPCCVTSCAGCPDGRPRAGVGRFPSGAVMAAQAWGRLTQETAMGPTGLLRELRCRVRPAGP